MNTLPTRSAWTHALCDPCWYSVQKELGGREKPPARVLPAKREICCECSLPTLSGIYYREHPRLLNCLGEHSNA